jgi:hypothetical protein
MEKAFVLKQHWLVHRQKNARMNMAFNHQYLATSKRKFITVNSPEKIWQPDNNIADLNTKPPPVN